MSGISSVRYQRGLSFLLFGNRPVVDRFSTDFFDLLGWPFGADVGFVGDDAGTDFQLFPEYRTQFVID